ncbi:MAG: DUF6371 domain-containing protein [Flavobacteriales bacterium]
MSHPHRFILEPYKGPSTRYACPHCGKPKEFSRYVDTDTGELLPEHVGKCNRADHCGYHYTPKSYFANGGTRPTEGSIQRPEPPPSLPFLHDRAEVMAARQHPDRNTLSVYWRGRIGAERWDAVVRDYALGTWPGGRMAGAAVYWQVDIHGHVRGGKVMLYDPATGHRSKEGGTTWVHALKGGIPEGFHLEQCLFGEHLLPRRPDAVVAVVESEKTAMIAAALMPDYLWVATGSKSEFKLAKLQVLTGRKVLAFPDLSDSRSSTFYYWKEKAVELRSLFASMHVSDYLEAGATMESMMAGMDIADQLLQEAADTTSAPSPADTIPALPQRILSEAEKTIQRMAMRNPSVNTLVDELGLDLTTATILQRPVAAHAA